MQWIANLKSKLKQSEEMLNKFIANVIEEPTYSKLEESSSSNVSPAGMNNQIKGSSSKWTNNF